MRHLIFALLLSVCSCASVAHAQDGAFDPGFATGGRELLDVSTGPHDQGRVMRVLPDGKLLMAGTCTAVTTVDGAPVNYSKLCATQLFADGRRDPSFGWAGGSVRFDVFEGYPSYFPKFVDLTDMVRLSDGRIVLLGIRAGADPVGYLVVVLAANGMTLDPAVGGGKGYITLSTPITYALALLVQADGKLLIVGTDQSSGTSVDMAVTRLLPDFTLDTGFGNAGYQTVAFDLEGPFSAKQDDAEGGAVQTDGKILLIGRAIRSYYEREVAIARLLPNGQLDPQFGPDHDGRAHFALAGDNDSPSVRVDPFGRIIFGATTTSSTTPGFQYCAINRLLADGSQDPTFNAIGGVAQLLHFTVPVGGIDTGCVLADLEVQSDATIFAAARTYRDATTGNAYFAVAKVRPDGVLDSTFGVGGRSFSSFASAANSTDMATSVAVGNGGVMVAGYSTNAAGDDTQFGIARLILDRIFKDGFDD